MYHHHHHGGHHESRVERIEHKMAAHDLARGNIVGALVHDARAHQAHAMAEHHHHHHPHHHHHGGFGGSAIGMGPTAVGASIIAGAIAGAFAPPPIYQPAPTIIVAPSGYPQPMMPPQPQYAPPQPQYAPPPPQGYPPQSSYPPQQAAYPPQQQAPQGQWVPAQPPQWSLTPAFVGQQSGGAGPDGRVLYQMMVRVG